MVKSLVEGQLINAPFLSGVGKVMKFEKKPGGYYKLDVVLLANSKFNSYQLSEEEVQKIEIQDQGGQVLEDSEDFFLGIEASRLRLAYQFDPLLAVSTSKIEPLPHQISAVYEYALKNSPKVRYMIADDAGAGKTIMGGLIIKELQYRNLATKILVVVPGHLKYQWQREMNDKFDTKFRMINRDVIKSSFSENIWDEHELCISTIDFIKQDDILPTLRSTHWDLVVVDEAHKLAAYKYGDEKIKKTDRYQAGEVLSRQSTHMLFLTATPHKGDKENFRLFLDLLRPGYFYKEGLVEESIHQGDNPIFIRRLKEDLKDFDGNKLFPPRNVITAKFDLTSAERRLYENVTRYVQDYFDQAKERRYIGFAMMILQRRLTSSTNAILKSLKRRKEKLENWLELQNQISRDEEYKEVKDKSEDELEAEMEEMEEEKRWELEEKLTNITIANNSEEVKKEIEIVDELINIAEDVKDQEIENKLKKLKEEILENLGDRKLLIFTEFKDTLGYLIEKLEGWGYSTTKIEGGMKMEERVEAEKDFKDNRQIMVATEAAGEGINLQFCSWMVNYDIPWNPTRLEQRMGRIHRYGQDQEVFIWNLISKNTREGQILGKIFTRLEEMRDDLGTDRVFDIIGEDIPGTNFGKMFREAIFEQRKIDEIYDEIAHAGNDDAKEKIKEATAEGLATKHLNYSGLTKMRMKAEENRLVPEYVKDYFLRAFNKLDNSQTGRITKTKDYYRIESIPPKLRRLNKKDWFIKTYGKIDKQYKKVTFNKELAGNSNYEQIAPGHPLLEAINTKILDKIENTESIAFFTDPTEKKIGTLWFYEGEVKDGADTVAGRKIFCLHRDNDGKIKSTNPSVLWDLKSKKVDSENIDSEKYQNYRDELKGYLVNNLLFPYKKQIKEDRIRETKIKKKYGLKSLYYLITESNNKILEYEAKISEGKDYEQPKRNEERNLEYLEHKREELEQQIEEEKNLTVTEPIFKGMAIVSPPEDKAYSGGRDMVSDEEIEMVGMQESINYEENNGWTPEDVSEENLGFDIRSVQYGDDGSVKGHRYIEVKARSREGGVRLSSNEWKKAKRFGDSFWLYVVINAGTENPNLYRIQNPAERFRLNEDIYATGYKIPLKNILEA